MGRIQKSEATDTTGISGNGALLIEEFDDICSVDELGMRIDGEIQSYFL
jgi:hypothetical protein